MEVVNNGGKESYETQEHHLGFLVARSYPAAALGSLKEVFHMVALLIGLFVVAGRGLPVRFRRNAYLNSSVSEILAQCVHVIGFVGKHGLARPNVRSNFGGMGGVMALAWREIKFDSMPQRIDNSVNLCVAPPPLVIPIASS